MIECEIVESVPTAEDYNRLRASVGWRTNEIARVSLFLPRSLYCACAVHANKLIGMARIVGDGGLVFYIQDVIVLPEYQRRGVGTRLMDAVAAYLATHACANSVIGLMSALGKEPFYARYGFITRPNSNYGSGMTTDLGALTRALTLPKPV